MHHHIKALLQSALNIKNTIDIVLERPKNKDLGHFATPLALSLAKIEKTNPKLIAEEIAKILTNYAEFEKVETLNGFVNLILLVSNVNPIPVN